MAEHPPEQEEAQRLAESYKIFGALHPEFAVAGKLARAYLSLLAAYEDRSKAFERAAADCVRLEGRLHDALTLLRRFEYLDGLGHVGTCSVCGWPKSGHPGPGRYKGNAENTHEEGCSMDMVLKGLPAPRLAGVSPAEAEDEQHARAEHLREAREVEQHQEEKHERREAG